MESDRREGSIWWARVTAMPQRPEGQNGIEQGVFAKTGSHLREVRAQRATDQVQGRNHGFEYSHRPSVPYIGICGSLVVV